MRTPEEIAEAAVVITHAREPGNTQEALEDVWRVRFGGWLLAAKYTQRNAEDYAASWRKAIADAVRPLYDAARIFEELLAVACHDEAGLVELGRREERGRVLGWVDREEPTAMTPWAHDVLDRLRGFVEEAGPAGGPLPPAVARARIERLEGVLRQICDLHFSSGAAMHRLAEAALKEDR